MKLSEKIRILRTQKSISQEQLGYDLNKTRCYGISRQAVSEWENGKSEPKLNIVRELANYFGVSYDVLLDEDIDLNDKKVMDEVMTTSYLAKANVSTRSVIHYFKYLKIKWWDIVAAILLLISTCAFILLLIIFSNTNEVWCVWTSVPFIFVSSFCFVDVSFKIIKVMRRSGPTAGCLTNNHLRIECQKSLGTTLYSPITSIEYMKVTKNFKNIFGTIEIKIKERNKPIILKNIYLPNTLVNTFYEIVGPEKNLEDLEISGR